MSFNRPMLPFHCGLRWCHLVDRCTHIYTEIDRFRLNLNQLLLTFLSFFLLASVSVSVCLCVHLSDSESIWDSHTQVVDLPRTQHEHKPKEQMYRDEKRTERIGVYNMNQPNVEAWGFISIRQISSSSHRLHCVSAALCSAALTWSVDIHQFSGGVFSSS